MASKEKILQQWLDKGFEELDSAECLSIHRNPTPDETICYLCQQAAEKYLKAYIFSNDIIPDNTHDLKMLLLKCQTYDAAFSALFSSAQILNAYGVMPRYPNDLGITEEDMRKALSNAKRIQEFVLKIFNSSNL